jgi:HEAT repeat protein
MRGRQWSIPAAQHTILQGNSGRKELSMSEYWNSVAHVGLADVQELMAELASPKPAERQHARELLVSVGRPAVGTLIRLLEDSRDLVRGEVVKTLADIGDRSAAPALVGALEDDDGHVRWLAADALIDLGPQAVKPLLSALAYRASSPELLEGAHHILSRLYWHDSPKVVKPVLAALDGPSPQMAVHLAAYSALNTLRSTPGGESPGSP